MENKTKLERIRGSAWGSPHPRIYRFLDKLASTTLARTLCVIGCADGAEVLPAVKRGFDTTAIDYDKTMLFGGTMKMGNNYYTIDGLSKRLKLLKLSSKATIVQGDFMKIIIPYKFTGVLVSGVLHYENNKNYSLAQMIKRIQGLVVAGGTVLVEYQHTTGRKHEDKYINKKEIEQFFNPTEWSITSHKVKEYRDRPNPRNYKNHSVKWGKLYATKIG